jgi:hypothetical protein
MSARDPEADPLGRQGDFRGKIWVFGHQDRLLRLGVFMSVMSTTVPLTGSVWFTRVLGSLEIILSDLSA